MTAKYTCRWEGRHSTDVAFALFNQLPRVQITALPRFFSLVPGLVDSIEIEPIKCQAMDATNAVTSGAKYYKKFFFSTKCYNLIFDTSPFAWIQAYGFNQFLPKYILHDFLSYLTVVCPLRTKRAQKKTTGQIWSLKIPACIKIKFNHGLKK